MSVYFWEIYFVHKLFIHSTLIEYLFSWRFKTELPPPKQNQQKSALKFVDNPAVERRGVVSSFGIWAGMELLQPRDWKWHHMTYGAGS